MSEIIILGRPWSSLLFSLKAMNILLREEKLCLPSSTSPTTPLVLSQPEPYYYDSSFSYTTSWASFQRWYSNGNYIRGLPFDSGTKVVALAIQVASDQDASGLAENSWRVKNTTTVLVQVVTIKTVHKDL